MATMMVEFVKIDDETGKVAIFHFPIPRIDKIKIAEEMPEPTEKDEKRLFAKYSATGIATINDLRAVCNVGDFLIIEDEVYRRIWGGWREATDDDLAELLAAKLGEVLEEKHVRQTKK